MDDVEATLEAERYRRGEPDPVSGALSRLALTQGSLLKEEYDHSLHAFSGGTVLGAAVIDVKHLTHLNMEHGFKAVDRALTEWVLALRAVCPKGKVVRIHNDAFAVILGPTAEQRVEPSLRPRVEQALSSASRQSLPGANPTFWIALLEVRVENPPNVDVLGPLLWGECERALVIERRALAGAGAVISRHHDFRATV